MLPVCRLDYFDSKLSSEALTEPFPFLYWRACPNPQAAPTASEKPQNASRPRRPTPPDTKPTHPHLKCPRPSRVSEPLQTAARDHSRAGSPHTSHVTVPA